MGLSADDLDINSVFSFHPVDLHLRFGTDYDSPAISTFHVTDDISRIRRVSYISICEVGDVFANLDRLRRIKLVMRMKIERNLILKIEHSRGWRRLCTAHQFTGVDKFSRAVERVQSSGLLTSRAGGLLGQLRFLCEVRVRLTKFTGSATDDLGRTGADCGTRRDLEVRPLFRSGGS